MPTTPGTELEYRYRGPQGESAAVLELIGARPSRGGATFTWAMETRGSAVRSVILDRACDERGAEEPWVALGAGGSALGSQTWRLPRSLRRSERYEGTIVARVADFAVTLQRAHRVVGDQTIEVMGTSYVAIRVAIEDTTEASAEPIESVAWIAPEVGLVRLQRGVGTEHEVIYELVSARIPR